MKKEIVTEKAPEAIGPYSQGVSMCRLIFTSGQIPVDPSTGEIPEGIEKQTVRSLENVRAVLEAGGSGMDKVLKVTVCLSDMNDFAAMNGVYSGFFTKPYPARTCFQAAALPKGVLVEIEAVASAE